jgi:poly-gamma-glutamate synthesis protein (capsule biosynthesis protein)
MIHRNWFTATHIIGALIAFILPYAAQQVYAPEVDVDASGTSTLTTPSPSPTPTIASPDPNVTTSLVFGGDVMLGRYVETRIREYGPSWVSDGIAPITSNADIAVVNLESPFRSNVPQTATNSLVLRGDPKGITTLTHAGIDVVSLANNHIPDMGVAGLMETQQLLADAGIAGTGAGTGAEMAAVPAIIERNGITFGFLSYTYGVNFDRSGVTYQQASLELMQSQVATLRKSVDVVSVLCHCGNEYAQHPTPTQRSFARAAIDAGATFAIGHHPHVPQPIEIYNGGVIAYSLGNLIFDQQPGAWRDASALLEVTMQGTTPESITLHPYTITKLAKPVFTTTEKATICTRFGISSCTQDL